jgi:chromosome segregation ATPase
MAPISEHEKLFDEICGKLAELSKKPTNSEASMTGEAWSDRIEKMHHQLKRSQDELKAAQVELETKIGSLENYSFVENDLQQENQRLNGQLEQERQINSKLNSDLAKSLELNLKLQFEIEEIRAKAQQVLTEEKKHNHYLQEKNKALSHELELSQALCQDTRMEFSKARDKFASDQTEWNNSRIQFERQIEELQNEVNTVTESILQFEDHSLKQSEMMKNLSSVAEKKIVELKMLLDKKALEAQDYYSHLQQSLNQATVLRQENAALKDYINKITALHQT